jgi:cell division protein FtsW
MNRRIPAFTRANLNVGARAVRDVAGEGLSAGARSVRSITSELTAPSWNEDRKLLQLPDELRQERLDLVVFTTAFLLFVLGLVMVFSAGAFVGQFHQAGPYDRLMKQAIRGVFGIGLLLTVARIDYRRWDAWSPWIAVVTVGFLLFVLLPGIGHKAKGATRWIGFGPLVIQPTEFARIGLIVYLARLLSKRPDKMDQFSTGPLPALIAAGVFAVLVVVQPSLGSALALGMTAVAMCVVAGMRWKQFFMIAAPVALLGTVVVVMAFLSLDKNAAAWLREYQFGRVVNWVAVWLGKANPQGDSYQLYQSITSIGLGGWLGEGIGAGQQKWYFLPDVHTDFIFSLIAEEMGFVGASCVLLLFGVLVWRGLQIALEAEDRYGYLLASGISVNFAVYAAINLGVTMGLLPTTGLPLPLVSYGGSALIANMVAVGLLLSVSRRRGRGILLGGRMRKRSAMGF